MNAPVTRSLDARKVAALRGALAAAGHALLRNPKNRYVDFEVRTEGRSIFTLYTSRKLVSTVRDGDAEGQVVEAEIARIAGAAALSQRAGVDAATPEGASSGGTGPAAARTSGRLARGASPGLRFLAGCDETGTGELIGTAAIGGALLPVALAEAVAAVAGHVDTKVSRAASGWEALGERLAALRGEGLVSVVLPIPNRLFDGWSKNGLLDLAYVRIVGDLLAAAGLPAGARDGDRPLAGLELVIDDYGAGELLDRAIACWRGAGALVLLQTKADENHLAARAASVVARSHRSREMQGLVASVTDGPLGTGNAGHPQTIAWLRRRARAGGDWPAFVKTSFRTVRQLAGLPEVRKRRVPPLHELLDEDAADDLLHGRLDVTTARLRGPGALLLARLRVTADGRLLDPASPCLAWEFLPLLCGGLVVDDSVVGADRLDELLEPERGLLCGWRVLVGPEHDADDRRLVALARAHRAGVVTVLQTACRDALQRCRRHAAVLLTAEPSGRALELHLA